jgi:hypothetical protein
VIQDELLYEAIVINKLRNETNRKIFSDQADRGAAEDREWSVAER